MKKLKAKNGQTYYYGKNGKRISEKEFQRRSKISASRKKSSKQKLQVKSRFKKNVYKGKDGTQITGWQREYSVNSSWVDNINDLLPLMLEKTLEIIDDVKASDITTKFVSFGYNFSVRHRNKSGEMTEFTNTGFSTRVNVNRSVIQFRELISESFDDISSRFEGYLQRESTSKVKLNFIILEKLISVKKAKKKK